MKRLRFFASLSLLAIHSAIAGEVTVDVFPSKTLGRDYESIIYVPDGYDSDADETYPVVYLLHGSFLSAEMWTEGLSIGARLDAMITDGKIPPVIAVMPTSESWWMDGLNEKAETAFFGELIPRIENGWAASPEREDRFVAGISAGGFGTIGYTMKHPDMFAAGAALSPASYEDLPPANSSAYEHPSFLDASGEFDEALWRSVNYPAFIDAYMKQDQVVSLYINSGDHDALDIAYHATVLYQRLRVHQPENTELRIVDGDHEFEVWDKTLDDALEFLLSR
ncbi:MAG: alpha/beta hydrolase-fold protein [Pseudomonadota bacterium]